MAQRLKFRNLRPVLLLWALGLLAVPAGAAAAVPTLHELPLATHSGRPAIEADGETWFPLSHGEAFTGDPDSAIGRLGPDGTFTAFSLPDDRTAGEPIAAPGGGIWFPENYEYEKGYGVGSLSPSGQLRQYTVSEGRGEVGSVALLGGDPWFVATHYRSERSVIGRIDVTTDGSVQRELALKPRCTAQALTAGDGALWFAETCERKVHSESVLYRGRIVRIDATGTVTRYPLAAKDEPSSVTIGPDGTVWFGAGRSDYSAPRIGLITPGGDVVEYPIPHGSPFSIAVGPGGRVWFPSSFGGGLKRALGSIGMNGHLSKPICVDPKCQLGAYGLSTGPDGSLWFSVSGQHTIGGGGETQIIEGQTIADEAGFVGRLAP